MTYCFDYLSGNIKHYNMAGGGEQLHRGNQCAANNFNTPVQHLLCIKMMSMWECVKHLIGH
jgi:hypothetical protein